MATTVAYPALYQANTRCWLTALSRQLGRPATLDDLPDDELDRLAALGFDRVWFLSVWQTGPAGQRVSRGRPEWREGFEATLPGLTDDDIAGSGFAITGYVTHPLLGGDAALARLRERLGRRGQRLLLDFVPDHTGLDHPWVEDHPDDHVAGTELELARAPGNYARVERRDRRPDRAAWAVRRVPAGRGGGAAGALRRDPAPDRPPARTARRGGPTGANRGSGRSPGELR